MKRRMINSKFLILLTKQCFTRLNQIKRDHQLNKTCINFYINMHEDIRLNLKRKPKQKKTNKSYRFKLSILGKLLCY